MRKIAIILTRKNSTRIKDKNSKNFFQRKSLLEIAILKLKESKQFELIINSTDCEKCKQISLRNNIKIHKRSKKNSLDNASSINSLKEVVKDLNILNDHIYLVQCTSPFLKLDTIKQFVEFSLYKDKTKIIASGNISKNDIWTLDYRRIFKNDPRRQQERKGYFIENSAIYKIPLIEGKICFNLNNFIFFQINEIEGFDINTELDWEIARSIVLNKNILKK